MIEIPSDLHSDCVPLAWLLGRWEGAGLGDYPTIEAFRFGQEVEFSYVPGKPFLSYTSRSWILDEDGNLVRPAARETGYWRPQADDEVEVLLTHPTGFVEIYLGQVEPAKVELATRGVLKTETAKDYRSGHRLYGLVNGNLMYVYEMAAMGQDLQPHLSAELKRVADATEASD
ncbi:FABP family protein [Phytoactinopolyspora endophytica]|uniref:FABP family protein n=1 Tax=Phytoactinopolyspora endophytica TaxID=1642495 RepID=UPI00101CD3F3|nr:FABP family protein [Phytoactinopolyspora endophytica]